MTSKLRSGRTQPAVARRLRSVVEAAASRAYAGRRRERRLLRQLAADAAKMIDMIVRTPSVFSRAFPPLAMQGLYSAPPSGPSRFMRLMDAAVEFTPMPGWPTADSHRGVKGGWGNGKV